MGVNPESQGKLKNQEYETTRIKAAKSNQD